MLADAMTNQQFADTALVIATKRLFNTSKHFCIIDFDRLCELAGVKPTREERSTLAALHCVNYVDMPSGFKEQLVLRVLSILQRTPEWTLEFSINRVPPMAIVPAIKELT